jgi:hypothetical protein
VIFSFFRKSINLTGQKPEWPLIKKLGAHRMNKSGITAAAFFCAYPSSVPASSGVEDHFITRQVHRPPVPVALRMTRRSGI